MNGLAKHGLSFSEIFLSNKKKQAVESCNNMDESQKHLAKWKNPGITDYILYDSICMKFLGRSKL